MNDWEEKYNKIIENYYYYVDNFSFNDPEFVGWNSKESQTARFKMMTNHIKNKSKVLDLGCGVGDLYGFLSDNKKVINYYGIDINDMYVAYAKIKYPGIKFTNCDIFNISEKFDYIIASGIFTFNMSKDDIRKTIDECLTKSPKMVFNVLKPSKEFDETNFLTYTIEQLSEILFGLKYKIKEDVEDYYIFLG